MDATITAPLQTTLSTQPSPKKNSKPNQDSFRRSSSSAPSTPNRTTQDLFHKNTTPTQPTTPLQPFWQKPNVVAAPSTQKTLPEVQDFLQKAYKTAHLSPQNAIAAAHLKAIAPVSPSTKSTAIVLDSLQKTWVTAQLPFHAAIPTNHTFPQRGSSQPSPSKSVTGALESLSRVVTASTMPDKNKTSQIEPSKIYNAEYSSYTNEMVHIFKAEQMGQSSTSSQTGATTSKVSQTGAYSPQTRTVLVGKRRQSSNLGKKEELLESELILSSETAKTVQRSQSENDGVKFKVVIPNMSRSFSVTENANAQPAHNTKVPFSAISDGSTRTRALQTATSVVEKSQSLNSSPIRISRSLSGSENVILAQSAQTSSSPSTSVSEKLSSKHSERTPKESPKRRGKSHVAQTYQTNKVSEGDRAANKSESATKSSKKDLPKQDDGSGPSQPANGRRSVNIIEEIIDPKKRVLASGFPPYTQTQDLMRVLSPFGLCRVDKCRNRLAVITFEKEESAKEAIKASEELCIYGEFIEIRPFTTTRHVEEMFRTYKKVIATQKGQDIIAPSQIDLSGDFYQQMEKVLSAVRLTREQVQAVSNLYADLEMVLQQEWPGCVAIPFGSIPTGLGIKSSDADCFVDLPAVCRNRGYGGAAFVQRVRRLLTYYPKVFTQLVAIPRANTPIVKFQHIPSGFHCDVSAKTPLGAQNSKLIKLLLESDSRLTPLAVLIKYWARVHELSGTGRLTNYALVMMLIFYLQSHAQILPPIHLLQRDHSFLVDHWNAGFGPRVPPTLNPSPLAIPDLLGGFFQYYANFDFANVAVCPYLGAPLPKVMFVALHLLPAEFSRYVTNVKENLASSIRHNTAFCVQDPFEQSHNVAAPVSARLAADIRAYMKHAADVYCGDRSQGRAAFLRTVLLTRPKLQRDRHKLSTKINLIPRLRGHISDPNWRAIVKGVILDLIFEKILQIALKRDSEKEEAYETAEAKLEAEAAEREKIRGAPKVKKNPKIKYDREVYAGSATKPVWRRKKNYSVNSPATGEQLVKRQRVATETILKSEADVKLEFELELGFKESPRSMYLFAKAVDGEPELFQGFSSFIHTAMYDWFRIMMRPHLGPPLDHAKFGAMAVKEVGKFVAKLGSTTDHARIVKIDDVDVHPLDEGDLLNIEPHADSDADAPAGPDSDVDAAADADTDVEAPAGADSDVEAHADIVRDLSAVSLADTNDSTSAPTDVS